MEGNCAIGRVLIPSTPRNKRIIEITIASAGRWRIFVNMVPSFSYLSFRVMFLVCQSLFRLAKLVFHVVLAVVNLLCPLEHELVVHRESALDHKDVVQLVLDDDLALMHHVV